MGVRISEEAEQSSTADQGGRRTGQAGLRSAPGPAGGVFPAGGLRTLSPSGLLAVQRLAGNRAASALVAPRTPASPDALAEAAGGSPLVIQRDKSGRNRNRNQKRRQKQKQKGGQTQTPTAPTVTSGARAPTTATAPAGGTGFFGSLASYASALWGATSITGGEDGEIESIGEGDKKQPLAWSKDVLERGEAESEEPEGDLLSRLIEIPRIEIKIERDGEALGGDMSGSGSLSAGSSGGSAKGEIEWEKAFAKGERTPIDLTVLGSKLTAKGEFSAGLKAGLEGELTATTQRFASKGKLAAFAGMEATGKTELDIDVYGHKVKASGEIGVAVGAGGELSYWVDYEGGQLRWGSKGKVVLGAGITWEYELVLPVASASSWMWSWMASMGSAMWNYGLLTGG